MLGLSLLDYSLTFKRRGVYDETDQADLPWEGQAYQPVSDASTPHIGIGGFQLLPLLAVSWDLGQRVPGLVVAAGVWAPQAYPARAMGADYVIDDLTEPPPASRYDIVTADAAVLYPSVAVAYQVLPTWDVGFRFSGANGELKAKMHLWGMTNYDEYTGRETIFAYEGKDNFSPVFQLGTTFRPAPQLEVAAQFTSETLFNTKGIGKVQNSANLVLPNGPPIVVPLADEIAQCATGGTQAELKACTDFALPMTAGLGARYVLRDAAGKEIGDLEANVQWENWASERASDYSTIVDGEVTGVGLKQALIKHGFRNVYSVRLGGHYSFGDLVARGGLAYDTAAAKPGWERVDVDGAARVTTAAGASYPIGPVRVDVGASFGFEGSRSVPGTCNTTLANPTCGGERVGPDPINPIIEPGNQMENPVNQGDYSSHYLQFMIGAAMEF